MVQFATLGANRCLSIVLLAAIFIGVSGGPRPRVDDSTVSHLDIRDAILSLLPVLRDQISKLERHEVRTRQVGDQMIKNVALLDKKVRTQDKGIDGLAAQLARSEETMQRMMETMQKRDEEHKSQMDKMVLAMEEMKQKLDSGGGGGSHHSNDDITQYVHDIRLKTYQMDETLQRQLNQMEDEFKQAQVRTEHQLARLHEAIEALESKYQQGGNDEKLRLAIEELRLVDNARKQQMNKFEEDVLRRLRVPTSTTTTTTAASVPSSPALDAILDALEGQQRQLEEVSEVVQQTRDEVLRLSQGIGATRHDIAAAATENRDGFDSLRQQLEASGDNSSGRIEAQVVQLRRELIQEQEEVGKRFEDTHALGEAILELLQRGHAEVMQEMQGMSNVESVLLDTADGVLDTKRRVEYGIQQILMEVSETVKKQSEDLSQAVQKRFDDLSALILHNQTAALQNLTSNMEREISQVWRQIGIMYNQLSLTVDMLDKIHSQTESYVSNSIKTMDSMDGKVGLITNRMGEVDGNLNYLVGRLSLVTQEFNAIKSGLGEALDNFREGLKEQNGELERREFTRPPPTDATNAEGTTQHNEAEEEELEINLPGSIN